MKKKTNGRMVRRETHKKLYGWKKTEQGRYGRFGRKPAEKKLFPA